MNVTYFVWGLAFFVFGILGLSFLNGVLFATGMYLIFSALDEEEIKTKRRRR